MITSIKGDWQDLLRQELSKEYYLNLSNFLEQEYKSYNIYPKKEDIFTALNETQFKNVRVVILGQDPYHNKGQADGMSFSVREGVRPPPSLMNIYKELELEYSYHMPKDYGCLLSWASQGVLLLNTVMTVREGCPNSHKNVGWETFTDAIISKLNENTKPCVFIFWGNNSKSKVQLVSSERHLILKSPHPSPLSAYRGFFGCGHFKAANEFLISNSRGEIDWRLQGISI